MVQQRAETPEIIYETMIADEALMALVGTCTFKAGGTQLDAISILTPGQSLPAVKEISGLEIVIHDINELTKKEYITNTADIISSWKVFLLAWNGADGSTINSAARRILDIFSKSVMIDTMPVPSGIGAIAQAIILIPSTSVINN